MRTDPLADSGDYAFEIDLKDGRVHTSPPLVSHEASSPSLEQRLPPSFLKFARTHSDGLWIDIGNALSIYPLINRAGDDWSDVLSITKRTRMLNAWLPSDFVFFAKTGVDTELFAFYTAVELENGEYPIVWFCQGADEDRPFVLVSSRFDRRASQNSWRERMMMQASWTNPK